ncbi:MAG: hypothetical protein E6I91_03535 [Chloroflexi bacterium]|nr:MAG: hypothetical protein E6I91_03535 [Chloroflexota bacterium]
MTRKESEKDSDRPHYYSQFWLDIAAGRRTIGGPKPNEDADTFEPELELDNVALRRSGRNSSSAIADDYEETIAHPEVEPEFDADEYTEPAFDEIDLDNEIEDEEIPNIVVEDTVEDTEIPDVDLASADDEVLADEVPADEFEDEEEFFDEDEDEDDLNWNAGRGKKKAKPRGATKQPSKPPAKKPGKREPRRGF